IQPPLLAGSLKVTEPWDGWDGRVLQGHGMVGMEGSFKVTEWLGWKGPSRSWNGWDGRVLQGHGMVGIEGSFKVTEWLGWKGPSRSWNGWDGRVLQCHGMVGMEGSFKVREHECRVQASPWSGPKLHRLWAVQCLYCQ
uniref:Uncharacterized protein n=1 Tax=Coturnix japonica TaxID=93934 RepID=A0A8C2SMG8_COTJA